MFKKIIVAIDGLEGGYDSLALADRFVDDQADASVLLVSAFPYETKRSRASVEGFEETLRTDTNAMLATVLEEAGHATDARYAARAVADVSPGRALHALAESEEADLIVIGSSRRGLIGRVLIGDVSRSTLHGSPVPVAVAPRGYRENSGSPIKLIGVGLNESPESDAALELAAQIAREAEGSLLLVLSIEVPKAMAPQYAYAIDWTEIEEGSRKAAHEQVSEVRERIGLPIEAEIADTSPGDALERASQRADLIVAGSRSYGAFRRVVLGSTSDWLAHHASCPLLVVPVTANDREQEHAQEATHA